MPKRVLIPGVLFILYGVASIWSMIEAAAHGRIYLNSGVFTLPIGIGLLRGKVSSQGWARFWIILGYIGVLLLLGFLFVYPHNATAWWPGSGIEGRRAVPYVAVPSILFGIILVVCHRLLYSPKACHYFAAGGSRRHPESGLRGTSPPPPG